MNLFKKYLEKVKEDSRKTERIAIRIYSEILGCYLWVVETDQDLHSLRATQGVSEAIYTSEEVEQLKTVNKEDIKAIHKIKETFENSKIETVSIKEGNSETDKNSQKETG